MRKRTTTTLLGRILQIIGSVLLTSSVGFLVVQWLGLPPIGQNMEHEGQHVAFGISLQILGTATIPFSLMLLVLGILFAPSKGRSFEKAVSSASIAVGIVAACLEIAILSSAWTTEKSAFVLLSGFGFLAPSVGLILLAILCFVRKV